MELETYEQNMVKLRWKLMNRMWFNYLWVEWSKKTNEQNVTRAINF